MANLNLSVRVKVRVRVKVGIMFMVNVRVWVTTWVCVRVRVRFKVSHPKEAAIMKLAQKSAAPMEQPSSTACKGIKGSGVASNSFVNFSGSWG